MLEEAVGFNTFRKDVIEAKQKLSGILSEEQSLSQLLDRARETLQYWREQNERLQEKKQLQTRMLFLQRELAWSRVLSLEKSVKDLEEELDKADSELYKAEEQMNQYAKAVVDSEGNMKRLRAEWMDIIEQRVESQRFLGVSEYSINVTKERIQTLEKMDAAGGKPLLSRTGAWVGSLWKPHFENCVWPGDCGCPLAAASNEGHEPVRLS